MTIIEKIHLDLEEIKNPKLLYQIQEFIGFIKQNMATNDSNVQKVLAYAGTISDEEANDLQKIIDDEF
mgnify:CR=1 FL=1